MKLENLLKEAAHSIISNITCLKRMSNILVICGKHNSDFPEYLMTECYAERAFPHLWVWNENLLYNQSGIVAEDYWAKLPEHTRALLQNSDLIIWLTQFQNPKDAITDLGIAVCSFWDKVYDAIQSKHRLLINLLSAKSIESMKIEYKRFLTAFANAVNVDYEKIRKTGSSIRATLEGRKHVDVRDQNGSNMSFSIENRKVGMEVGTLEDCFATGRECELEIPAGEVYVAPLESSACGRLIVDEVRDFGVRKLEMDFERGRIVSLRAEKGEAAFLNFLDNAQGSKDTLAEFGVGTNHGVKSIGLRIYDEKALGTVHLAIGNNVHLGGVNSASIHIDFNLYKPTVEADNNLIMKEGRVTEH